MKKLLVCILIAALVCSLSGCVLLDEMREKQAFLQTDGSVTWQGNTYQLLPAAEELYPELDYDKPLNVTAPDVPVLLSVFEMQGIYYPSKDGRFLENLSGEVYCRADFYEEISRRLQEGFEPALYCYFYDVYDRETWDYSEEKYVLTDEQVKAVETVCSTVLPYAASAMGRPEAIHSVYLYGCSSDMLLQACNTEIVVTTAGYSLLVYTEEDVMVFPVPDGMHDIFNQIMQAYITANDFTDMEADL